MAAQKTRKAKPAKPKPEADEDIPSPEYDDGLNDRQRAFVEHYLRVWSKAEAARLAGYSPATARQIGHALLTKVDISAAIDRRLSELKMSADEVLTRLSDHARGSMGDFLSVGPEGEPQLDIIRASDLKRLHLIKKAKTTKRYLENGQKEVTLEIELYDAQSALVQLGRAHTLFGDRTKNESWQDEIIRLLKEGKVTAEEVINELGRETATPLVVAAGARPDSGA